MTHKRTARALIAAAMLSGLGGCAAQKNTGNPATAKDVQVIDDGRHITNFASLRGSLFEQDGWIVWSGTAANADGSPAAEVHRRVRKSVLLAKLHADLDGTPFAAEVGRFMGMATSSTQNITVDLGVATLPDGSVVSAPDAMARVVLSAVDTIVSIGVVDPQA